MILITGAAGFIGSCLTARFNELGMEKLMLVDDFSIEVKRSNWEEKKYTQLIERDKFFNEANENIWTTIDFVYHLGARTDTTDSNKQIFDELNLDYSKKLWDICCKYKIPLVYASSAATYGEGELGFDDLLSNIPNFKPLNEYAISKHAFDRWALSQNQQPPNWAGLKFFNVYGPNEYHKSRMASVVMHAFKQISATGSMNLFRSHHPDYKDGEQLRDFIYVKDVCEICVGFMGKPVFGDIYNLGTGQARTFIDLVNLTFQALGKKANINWIDTPIDIRDKYQYFTEAKMDKLLTLFPEYQFKTIEEGVANYVKAYLVEGNYY
ncbi:UNVERIFIED_CONTAM: hypothetical protein GTU68_066452 [Idotea baltica]|nr:hypothetical protein [Idotea baltica]